MSASDAELVRSHDARAFGTLYARHAEAVHGWFSARVAWAAADLTAETFARAWLARRTFRDERDGSALPWLLGIGRNVLRESARHDRVETAARERLGLPVELGDDDFAAVDERLSPRPSLRAALDELPPHERRALELRVVDELPYDDVARSLRIRPAASTWSAGSSRTGGRTCSGNTSRGRASAPRRTAPCRRRLAGSWRRPRTRTASSACGTAVA